MNMMREIKFRAFLKLTKEIVDIKKIDFENNQISFYKNNGDAYLYVCDFKNIELMQFTGLCDKNGEKIYEGDVVRFNNQTGKVVYEYGSFGVGIEEGIDYDRLEDFTRENLDNTFEGTFNDNFLSLFEIYYNLNNIDGYIDEIEVIGNIFDNPELLGEQQ